MFWELFLKEWKENFWKLGFATVVSAAFIILLMRLRIITDGAVCVSISFVQMIGVGLVYALDIFSGEMNNRTIHLLFKLPVARWKIFFSKYVAAVVGMAIVFVISGLTMEAMGHGREAAPWFLFKINISFGIAAILLFTWFCGFASTARTESSSLIAYFGVLAGWSIVLFWSLLCEVRWVEKFVPYFVALLRFDDSRLNAWMATDFAVAKVAAAQIAGAVFILAIACSRYAKIMRYL